MSDMTMRVSAQLSQFGQAPLARKAAILQAIYQQVAFSPSEIMYSMQYYADGEIRPFTAQDFVGKTTLDTHVGKLQLDGPWDYLHGENAITASGLYLAAQAYRLKVGAEPEAVDEAARAFHSLERIFEMGVQAGMPGWMCKPYGFRPSNQTSPDQYLHACWGLYTYHAVAPSAHRRRIEDMIIAFADFWRHADYVLTYFGNHWDQKNEPGYSNATMMLVNVLAYHFSGDPVYRCETEWFREHQYWMQRSGVEELRRQYAEQWRASGRVDAVPSGMPWVTPLLQPGETLLWEQACLCEFAAVAADVIHQLQPDLLGDSLPGLMAQWWRQGQYGIGDDLLPYYWFALDLVHDTWRPLPSTELAPREQWAFGDPLMGAVSQVRWCDPLARAMAASVIAQRHVPAMAEQIRAQATRLMDGTDATRLHWIVDPDGRQLLPEISYYGQCLSSEVPATFLAAYWRGRLEGLWE